MSVVEQNKAKRAQLLDCSNPKLSELQALLVKLSKINRHNPLTWPKYFYLLAKASKLILKDIKK